MSRPDVPYQEHAPAAALAGVIDRVWVRRCSAGERGAEVQRVLPDRCVDVLFHLGAQPRVVAVGAMTRPRLVPGGPSDIVAVRFRPGGAARSFAVPIDTLTDLHVPVVALAIEARPTLDALLASPHPRGPNGHRPDTRRAHGRGHHFSDLQHLRAAIARA